MATEKQKETARHNLEKARDAQSARAHGKKVPHSTETMSTADKNKLDDEKFAFPDERKEPLTDAKHVRNAIAQRMNEEIDHALGTAAVQGRFSSEGFERARMTPAEFAALIRRDIARWAPLAKRLMQLDAVK